MLAAIILLVPSGFTGARDADPFATPEPGFMSLFDGTESSFADWQAIGPIPFALEDGFIVTGSDVELYDIGLLYYTPRAFGDFILRLQFRIADPADNSGVFVRFRDPVAPVPGDLLEQASAGAAFPNRDMYAANGAWTAVDTGFEVQIDDMAAGEPDGEDRHRTGAIYDIPIGSNADQQAYQRGSALEPGRWYDLEVEVLGNTYTVRLDGELTTTFTNQNSHRGRAPADDSQSGYIGIQSHPYIAGHVAFRDIRIKDLSDSTPQAAATPIGSTSNGDPKVLWQTSGAPDLPLDDPFQLTVDPLGNLWVTDSLNNRFQILAPDGSFRDIWGETGRDEGEFSFYSGAQFDLTGAVAFDSHQNIYVLDSGNDRVQKFDPARSFVTAWGESGEAEGQFGHPFDIAVGNGDRVYVIDDQRNDVQVFDVEGAFLFSFGGPGTDEGELFDTGSLTIAPDGAVWVADWGNERIQKFSPDGEFILAAGAPGTGPGQFLGPLDVATDALGRVYVTDCCSFRILVFDENGQFLTEFGRFGVGEGAFVAPGGIAIDAAGTIYASDAGLDRVTAFAPLPQILPTTVSATPETNPGG
jgi:DNA-binding beta-propeller fold protein YncE